MNKKIKKLRERKCYFCPEDNYDLLDVHRIVPGEEGGKYTDHNTVVVCCKCHRLIHSGAIRVDRWYSSTDGRILHYFLEEVEFWK